MDPLETLWTNILSREPRRIRDTWETLSAEEQDAIYTHLNRMVTEEGWTEPQRLSAQAALDALCDLSNSAE